MWRPRPERPDTKMTPGFLDWVVVAAFGALVGAAELISRYRADPFRALCTWPAIIYLSLNGAASLAALGLMRLFGLTFGQEGARAAWMQVLVAGTAAMVLIRGSLLIPRVGDHDVPVGLSSLLQVFLNVAEGQVGRVRAQARCKPLATVMAGVDYAKAHHNLTAFCLELMKEEVPEQRQKMLANAVQTLDTADLAPRVKVLILGVLLADVVGIDVLREAVEVIRNDIACE